MDIRLFRTNVSCESQIEVLRPQLDSLLKNKQWNFDLEDCDKVLRIEAKRLPLQKLKMMMTENEFQLTELF